MSKLALLILLAFSFEAYAKGTKVLSIVSFNGKKLLITDNVTKETSRIKNKKIKLPIAIKKVLNGGKYLINLNGKDTVVSKIYVNTDKVIPIITCPKTSISIKNTASTRGLGNKCQQN